MVPINLLPWRAVKREQLKRHFFISLGAAAAGAIVLLCIVYLYVGGKIDTANHDNIYLQNKINELTKQTLLVDELLAKQQAVQMQIGLINTLQHDRDYPVKLMETLVESMPPGSYLVSVKYDSNTVTLQGISNSSAQVTTLLNNLNTSLALTDAKLIDLKTASGMGGVTQGFTITATVKKI